MPEHVLSIAVHPMGARYPRITSFRVDEWNKDVAIRAIKSLRKIGERSVSFSFQTVDEDEKVLDESPEYLFGTVVQLSALEENPNAQPFLEEVREKYGEDTQLVKTDIGTYAPYIGGSMEVLEPLGMPEWTPGWYLECSHLAPVMSDITMVPLEVSGDTADPASFKALASQQRTEDGTPAYAYRVVRVLAKGMHFVRSGKVYLTGEVLTREALDLSNDYHREILEAMDNHNVERVLAIGKEILQPFGEEDVLLAEEPA